MQAVGGPAKHSTGGKPSAVEPEVVSHTVVEHLGFWRALCLATQQGGSPGLLAMGSPAAGSHWESRRGIVAFSGGSPAEQVSFC